jgi:RNA-dependent RNA polymerase
MRDTAFYDEFMHQLIDLSMVTQFRVHVGPTTNYFEKGAYEESNRVLRNYETMYDRFLRVSFVNDKKEKGFYFADHALHYIGYIRKIINKGFYLGKYYFKFAGYSNSQIKNHSCWFYAEN